MPKINTKELKELQKLEKLREYKVVKSNDIIQKSRFNLSIQEQKIILYMISRIKPGDENFEVQHFNITEFCKICGIDSTSGKNYKDIKAKIKTLSDKSAWVKLDNGSETLVRWINKATVHNKSGTIELCLGDLMKPYLLHLQEHFTQYELSYTLAMKSQYSIRLYELLKSYEYRREVTFGVDELRQLLSAETYHRFPDFKRRVLDMALKEINHLTDLTATYDIDKKGKKAVALEFYIEPKEKTKDRVQAWLNTNEILNNQKKLPPTQERDDDTGQA